MRSPFSAAVLGLSLVGCLTVGEAGPSGTGGDDDMGPGPGPSPGPADTAKVDVTLDKPTLMTELKTANPITVTVKGSGGFSGEVTLTATMTDASGAALPGWTVDLSAPSVTLTADGTATAVATVKVPPLSAGLVGTVKVTGASSTTLGTNVAASMVTALKQVTFAIKVDSTGKCVYPADGGNASKPVTVAVGTKIRFFNTGTANFEIHSNNKALIAHQGQPPGAPGAPDGTADPVTEANTAFEQTPTITGNTSWYCHAPGDDLGANNPKIIVQ